MKLFNNNFIKFVKRQPEWALRFCFFFPQYMLMMFFIAKYSGEPLSPYAPLIGISIYILAKALEHFAFGPLITYLKNRWEQRKLNS